MMPKSACPQQKLSMLTALTLNVTAPFRLLSSSGVYGVLSRSNSANVAAYEARSGWDFASGIGTVNATNLVTKWDSVAP
jgi:hypothetical protein